jgi:hypothetical protein
VHDTGDVPADALAVFGGGKIPDLATVQRHRPHRHARLVRAWFGFVDHTQLEAARRSGRATRARFSAAIGDSTDVPFSHGSPMGHDGSACDWT